MSPTRSANFRCFYRVAPFAFIGGSLVLRGGQNPFEAARLGRAVMAGPYTNNFAGIYEAIFAAQGAAVFTGAGISSRLAGAGSPIPGPRGRRAPLRRAGGDTGRRAREDADRSRKLCSCARLSSGGAPMTSARLAARRALADRRALWSDDRDQALVAEALAHARSRHLRREPDRRRHRQNARRDRGRASAAAAGAPVAFLARGYGRKGSGRGACRSLESTMREQSAMSRCCWRERRQPLSRRNRAGAHGWRDAGRARYRDG